MRPPIGHTEAALVLYDYHCGWTLNTESFSVRRVHAVLILCQLPSRSAAVVDSAATMADVCERRHILLFCTGFPILEVVDGFEFVSS